MDQEIVCQKMIIFNNKSFESNGKLTIKETRKYKTFSFDQNLKIKLISKQLLARQTENM